MFEADMADLFGMLFIRLSHAHFSAALHGIPSV